MLAYKSLLTDTLKILGKSDIKSTSIANNFYNFEKRLAGIINENDFDNKINNEYTTINELKTRMSNVCINYKVNHLELLSNTSHLLKYSHKILFRYPIICIQFYFYFSFS